MVSADQLHPDARLRFSRKRRLPFHSFPVMLGILVIRLEDEGRDRLAVLRANEPSVVQHDGFQPLVHMRDSRNDHSTGRMAEGADVIQVQTAEEQMSLRLVPKL